MVMNRVEKPASVSIGTAYIRRMGPATAGWVRTTTTSIRRIHGRNSATGEYSIIVYCSLLIENAKVM